MSATGDIPESAIFNRIAGNFASVPNFSVRVLHEACIANTLSPVPRPRPRTNPFKMLPLAPLSEHPRKLHAHHVIVPLSSRLLVKLDISW